jgi:hypothetical protein
MNDTLNKLYPPQTRNRPFPGQLTEAFQRQLQEAHAAVKPEDCHFYHTLDLGNGEVIPGGWDIRGNENNYMGHVKYDGLRVLECGSASGYLSFWMESQGARVVALDLPPGHAPDLVPLQDIDLNANAASGTVTAEQVRNSWWYAHRKRQSRAAVIYADIYALPPDIGRFDVSTFGSILLHLGNPFKALSEAALVTDKAIVVTDLLPGVIYGDKGSSLIEFNPGNETRNLVNWWNFSPEAIRKMLMVLGFPHVDFHYFENDYHPHHDPQAPAHTRFMFAAVGQRAPDALPRVPKTEDDKCTHERLRECVPVINVEKYNDAHRQLGEANAQLGKIYRSLAWKLTKPLRMLTGL